LGLEYFEIPKCQITDDVIDYNAILNTVSSTNIYDKKEGMGLKI
jgi:hypothetical protein